MKLEKVDLENFLCYEKAVIELPRPINIFLGNNHAGKTPILDGIDWALRGACRAMVGRRGEEGVLRNATGVRKAIVSLTIGGTQIQRTRTIGGTVSLKIVPRGSDLSKLGTPTELQQVIFKALRADDGVIRSVLHGSHFVYLSPTERQKMIMDLFGARRTTKILDKILEKAKISDDDAGVLRQAFSEKGIDAAEKVAVQRRQEAKRAHKELGILSPPQDSAVEIYGKSGELVKVFVSKTNMEPLRTLLAEKEALQRTLLERRGKLEGTKELQTRIEEKKKLHAGICEQIRVLLPVEHEEKAVAKTCLAQLEQAKEKQKEIQGLLDKLTLERIKLGAAQKVFEELGKLKDRCIPFPTLPCKLTATDKKKALASQKRIVVSAKGIVDELAGKLEVLEMAQKELLDEIKGSEDMLRIGLKPKLTELRNLRASEDILAKEVTSAHEEQNQTSDASIGSVGAELGKLDNEIELLRVLYQTAEHYQSALRTQKAQLQHKTDLTKEVSRWDDLAKALAPAGAAKDFTEDPLSKFRDRLKFTAEGLGIGGLAIDESFDLSLGGIPVAWCGMSEQFLIGVACQEAIAHTSGMKFLAIDGIDVLDKSSQRTLLEFVLSELRGEYNKIMLFSSASKRPTRVSQDTDIQTWWVEGGTIQPIK